MLKFKFKFHDLYKFRKKSVQEYSQTQNQYTYMYSTSFYADHSACVV
jgi:hypothetical protein